MFVNSKHVVFNLNVKYIVLLIINNLNWLNRKFACRSKSNSILKYFTIVTI